MPDHAKYIATTGAGGSAVHVRSTMRGGVGYVLLAETADFAIAQKIVRGLELVDEQERSDG